MERSGGAKPLCPISSPSPLKKELLKDDQKNTHNGTPIPFSIKIAA
jgi:hypothetical protein